MASCTRPSVTVFPTASALTLWEVVLEFALTAVLALVFGADNTDASSRVAATSDDDNEILGDDNEFLHDDSEV